MTAPTTEAIASPRPATRRRGAVALVRTGLGEMLGRRRLTRYLVGADLKRTHADTAVRPALVGPRPAPPDGRLLHPRDDHLPADQTPDYPLFIFAAILPWKWFSTTLNDATLSVTGRQSLIRQIQFPKIVLPTSARHRRDGELRVRAHRPRHRLPLLPRPAQPVGPAACRSSPPSSSLFTIGAGHPALGAERLLPRHPERPAPRPAAVVLPVAGRCTPLDGDRRTATRSSTRSCRSTRSRSCSSRIAPVIYGTDRPGLGPAARAVVLRLFSLSCLLLVGVYRLQARRAGLREDPLMGTERRRPTVMDRPAGGGRERTGRRDPRPRHPLRPAPDEADDAQGLARRDAPPRRGPREPLLGAPPPVDLTPRPRRVARGHRAERRGQEHAAAGAGRHPRADRGRDRDPRPGLDAADPGCRLRAWS